MGVIGLAGIFLLTGIFALSFIPQSEAEVPGLSYTTVHPISDPYSPGTFDTWIEDPSNTDKGIAVEDSDDGKTIVRISNSKWQTFIFKNATDATQVSDGPAISPTADIQSLIIKANLTNVGDSKAGKVLVGCEIGNNNPNIFNGPTESIAPGETRVIEFDYGSTNPATGVQWVSGDVDDWINSEGEQLACGVLNQDKQKLSPMFVDEIWIRIGVADSQPPTGSVDIIPKDSADFEKTEDNDVKLSVTCDDNGGSGCDHFRISYDDGANWSGEIPISDGTFEIDGTGFEDLPSDRGVKTILVELVDKNNNAATSDFITGVPFDDTIELFASFVSIDGSGINPAPLWAVDSLSLSGSWLNALDDDKTRILWGGPISLSAIDDTDGTWSNSTTYDKYDIDGNNHTILVSLVNSSGDVVEGISGDLTTDPTDFPPIEVLPHQLGLEVSISPGQPLPGFLVQGTIRVVDTDMPGDEGILPGVDAITIQITGNGTSGWDTSLVSSPFVINDTNNLITVNNTSEVMHVNVGTEFFSNIPLNYFYMQFGNETGDITVEAFVDGVSAGTFTSSSATDDLKATISGYVDVGGKGATSFKFTENNGDTETIGIELLTGSNSYSLEVLNFPLGLQEIADPGTYNYVTRNGLASSSGFAPSDWPTLGIVNTEAIGNPYYIGTGVVPGSYTTQDPLSSVAGFGGGAPTTPDSGTGIAGFVCARDNDKDGLCNGWENLGTIPYTVNGVTYYYTLDPPPAGKSIPDIYYEVDAQSFHAPRSLVTGNADPADPTLNIKSAFYANNYRLHLLVDETTLPDVLYTNVWRDNDLIRDNDFDNIKADRYGKPNERAEIESTQTSLLNGTKITISDVKIKKTPADINTGDITEGKITLRNIIETGNGATVSFTAGVTKPAALNHLSVLTTDVHELASDNSKDRFELVTKLLYRTNGQITTPTSINDVVLTVTSSQTINSVSDVAPVTPAITSTLQDARALVYRYLLYVHDTGGSSGHAERLGNDAIVSLGNGFNKQVSGHTGSIGSKIQEAGTTMHEIGHNLNLMHGGPYALTTGTFAGLPIADAEVNCKPNYPSVMSYSKQMNYFVGSNWVPDFSDGTHGPLTDTPSINTLPGSSVHIVWGIPFGNPSFDGALSDSNINWGGSTDVNNLGISGCQASADGTYYDYDDWANLNLQFASAPGGTFDGSHGPAVNDVNNIISIQASIKNAAFSELQSPLKTIGSTVKIDRGNLPIKFDLHTIGNVTDSIINLERYIVLTYTVFDDNDNVIETGVLETLEDQEPPLCEYDANGFYNCDSSPRWLAGTYKWEIKLKDPVTGELSETLLSEIPKYKKVHPWSFIFTAE
jgi:hypothetical protein